MTPTRAVVGLDIGLDGTVVARPNWRPSPTVSRETRQTVDPFQGPHHPRSVPAGTPSPDDDTT